MHATSNVWALIVDVDYFMQMDQWRLVVYLYPNDSSAKPAVSIQLGPPIMLAMLPIVYPDAARK
jgi:hypothetical protein